ncbi:MAG TPA: isoprenylcysteine carboxylmethyltransferase family protein [Bryobacteraceae bacterium]|nr:isoprenylcysteine carboxylmethyltransferase family protein [Bryobacteraceae bacterium]
MNLKTRLVIRLVLLLTFLAAVLFLPAGSFRFWQAWPVLGLSILFNVLTGVYFYRRDPRLLERRLLNKEERPEQKLLKLIWMPLWFLTFVVPGLDYRFGWSAAYLGGVPVWLTLLSQVILVSSWVLIFQVLKFNSFAATVVQVEAGQKVISTGPYRIVRHPMYSAIVVTAVATPLALGSYFAFAPALLMIPAFVLRLLNEERVLRQELTGYAEYCLQTRFRLVPNIW